MNLITGSNGSCAHYLKQELGEWVGMARPSCDLLDEMAIETHLYSSRPDVIYHLAANANVRESFDKPVTVFANNTLGTIKLFEACRTVGIKPVIVICSTSEVYGNPGAWPIQEGFATDRQTNPYAVSKRAQESIAKFYEGCYGFPVVITRAFGYVNPRRADLSLTSFARQIVKIEHGEQQEVVHGNLDSIRTFCDVRDVAKAYVKAAAHSGQTFNIGSETPVSIKECLEILISYAQAEILTRQDEALMRPQDVTNIVPDCTAFRKATGWEPKIPLKDSLRWLLEQCRST